MDIGTSAGGAQSHFVQPLYVSLKNLLYRRNLVDGLSASPRYEVRITILQRQQSLPAAERGALRTNSTQNYDKKLHHCGRPALSVGAPACWRSSSSLKVVLFHN